MMPLGIMAAMDRSIAALLVQSRREVAYLPQWDSMVAKWVWEQRLASGTGTGHSLHNKRQVRLWLNKKT